jgi:hypothetical protein
MSTWAHLRVYFGALLLALFALGVFLVVTSSLADRQSGPGQSGLRALGAELIALSVFSAVVAVVLKGRLSEDEKFVPDSRAWM